VLRAALALFIEHGAAGASIEKIARRARVARTSIYRRWPSREALLAQAVEVARNATGYSAELLDRTPPEEMAKLLLGACDVVARLEMRNLVARLIGSLPDFPRLMEIYREDYYLPRRRAFLRAMTRAKAARLLGSDTDIDALADMFIGVLTHRLLLAPSSGDTAAALRCDVARLLRHAGFVF
jgi:AcrR family transcriptional regulator